MDNGNKKFTYEYSAKQQEEINEIRKKYEPKSGSKMDELRELDKRVETAGTGWSVTAGIIGTLLLGVGMCCTMVWADKFFVIGIIVGIIGMAVIAAAYPINNYCVKKKREKLTPQILRLTDELSDN